MNKVKEVVAMLKTIHAQEDKEKLDLVVEKPYKTKFGKVSKHVSANSAETLNYMNYPGTHWEKIWTNNPLERVICKIRKRTRVIGAFPYGQ